MMSIRTFQQTFVQSRKLYKQGFSSVARLLCCIALAASVCAYLYFSPSVLRAPSLAGASLGLLFAVLSWLFASVFCLGLNHCYNGQPGFQWRTIKQACCRLPRIFFGVLLLSLCFRAFSIVLVYWIGTSLDSIPPQTLKNLGGGALGFDMLLGSTFIAAMILSILFFSPWLKMYYFVLLLDKKCGFFSAFSTACRLLRGKYWNTFFMVFGTGFLLGVWMCVLFFLIGFVLTAIGFTNSLKPDVFTGIVGAIDIFMTTLILPLIIGMFLIHYHRLREQQVEVSHASK